MIIAQPKEEIAKFVSSMTASDGLPFPFGEFSALGLVKNNELVAGVVYNYYTTENIAMHIAAIPGRRWMTREFLYAMFDYPFNQLGVIRATGMIAKKNRDCRRFAEHCGFEYEGNMRKAMPDDDLIIYGLMRENCKWLTILKKAA